MPVMTQDLLDSGMTQAQIDEMQRANDAKFAEETKIVEEIQARAAKVAELEKQLASAQAGDKAKIQEKISTIVNTPAEKPLPLSARIPPIVLPEGAAKMGLTALGLLGGVGALYLLFRSPPKKAGGKPGGMAPAKVAGDRYRRYGYGRSRGWGW